MFKKITIIFIAILFIWNICLTMKKNKEKFGQPTISQQNLQAISNLGTLAEQIINNGNTLLTIDDLQIKVGNTLTRLSEWIVSTNSAIQGKLDSIDSAIKTNLTNSDSTLETAIKTNLTNSDSTLKTAIATNLTNSDSTLQELKSDFNYFKKLMRNHTHEYNIKFQSQGIGSTEGEVENRNKKPIVVLKNKGGNMGQYDECQSAGFELSDDDLYNYYDDKTIEFQNDASQILKTTNSKRAICKIGIGDSPPHNINNIYKKDRYHT
jgi:hypothetical protein